MDQDRFDQLTRKLANGLSRRNVIKGLAGGSAAAMAAFLGRTTADAGKVTQAYCGNTVCADNPSVCRDGCVCCGFANGNNRCMPPRDCQRLGGELGCPAGMTSCAGTCMDTTSDLQHCGSCDNQCRLTPVAGSCELDPICVAGQCGFTPQPAGRTCGEAAGPCAAAAVCDGSAIDCPPPTFQLATVECRAAAGPCDVAEYCTGDAAACPDDAFANATVPCRAASCADGVATQAANCPGDGADCPGVTTKPCAPYLCGATACLESCSGPDHEDCVPGYHCDGGHCLLDEGLGESCDEDSDCQSGVCTATGICCNEACDAVCHVCGSDGICVTAANGASCGDGDAGVCCAGDCIDSATDVNHCGGCDQSCPAIEGGHVACVGGSCTIACDTGFQACHGACISNDTCCTESGPGCCGPYACVPGQTACPTSCDNDSDCFPFPVGVCRQSECVVDVLTYRCFNDTDCPTGMSCTPPKNNCVPQEVCADDAHCLNLGWLRCIDGICSSNSPCTDNSDCELCVEETSCPGGVCCSAFGLTCVEGRCSDVRNFCTDMPWNTQGDGTARLAWPDLQRPEPVRLNYAPERVWHALTDSAAIAGWAFATDFVPTVGHRFTVQSSPRTGFDDVLAGEVVAVEAQRLLAFTLLGGPLTEPTTVTVRLEADGDGTLLSLQHTSTDGSACVAARRLLGPTWELATMRHALPRYLGRQARPN